MWTLVDIDMGWVIHCECYRSAVKYRLLVGRGVLVRDDSKLGAIMIRQARGVYGKH